LLRNHGLAVFALLLIVFLVPVVHSQDRSIYFREDFISLDRWKSFYFPKIPEHSSYTAESEGQDTHLRAESNVSAAAIIYKDTLNVYKYPRIRWRWKVENAYRKGDARSKEGDDYPIRIYINLPVRPQKSRFRQKAKI